MKVCVVIGSRANYSSIKSLMSAIVDHPNLSLQLVGMASAVLDRFGNVSTLIEDDGFAFDEKLYTQVEGSSPSTMAKSTGLALIELSSVFDRLSPDFVVTVGDRYETMATTLAASYMNIPLAHTMGGEVTGTIDESIRHAITKFAHLHFAASADAASRIIKLGEDPRRVFNVGCPRIDLVKQYLQTIPPDLHDLSISEGVGGPFDPSKPFLLVSQHPVTTEYGSGEHDITETLTAVSEFNLQSIILWPNSDAGSDDISRGIRKWRENHPCDLMHFFKNVSVHQYVHLLKNTLCIIGNSSSGIREGAFIGTPCVNIGSRQSSRERGSNVIDVQASSEQIKLAVQEHINHGHYATDPLYGDGSAGTRIADLICKNSAITVQKQITY